MDTREIEAPRWLAFLDEFSRLHQGTTATVDLVSPDIGAQHVAVDQPFVGLVYDPKGSEHGSIDIILGGEADDRAEHLIKRPAHVWTRTGSEYDSDALEIESEDGSKTVLTLQQMPALTR